MHWLIRVFDRSFVYRFYQAHLLVFLFAALIMFGMVDGNTLLKFHYAIFLTVFSSPFMVIIFWLVLCLYFANALRYLLNTLSQAEFQFLYISNSAQRTDLFKALCWTVIQINAPVLIYGCIGIIVAVVHTFYLNALLGLFALSLNVFITAWVVYYRLVNIHKSPLVAAFKLFPALRLKPGILSILLRQITSESKAALVGTKLFSCLVIYGAHYEWSSFNYDIRWMQVAMAISIPAQGVLLYQVWAFENTQLNFTRNFPIKIWKRYASILGLVLILLIPEALLLASYCIRFHILWQLPIYLLYAVAVPMLLYSMLYTNGFSRESFNSFLFALGMVTFFVSLFGFTWLLALIFVPISFMVYREAFYDFDGELK